MLWHTLRSHQHSAILRFGGWKDYGNHYVRIEHPDSANQGSPWKVCTIPVLLTNSIKCWLAGMYDNNLLYSLILPLPQFRIFSWRQYCAPGKGRCNNSVSRLWRKLHWEDRGVDGRIILILGRSAGRSVCRINCCWLSSAQAVFVFILSKTFAYFEMEPPLRRDDWSGFYWSHPF
jgi:hypothetical protein